MDPVLSMTKDPFPQTPMQDEAHFQQSEGKIEDLMGMVKKHRRELNPSTKEKIEKKISDSLKNNFGWKYSKAAWTDKWYDTFLSCDTQLICCMLFIIYHLLFIRWKIENAFIAPWLKSHTGLII